MPKSQYKRRKVAKNHSKIYIAIIIVLSLLVGAGLGIFSRQLGLFTDNSSVFSSDVASQEEPKPIVEVSSATIVSTGDLLMHMPIITGASTSGGNYDFSSIFTKIEPILSSADYAVANLETTFAGTGKKYSGYPQFNCPDSLADAVKNAGFDMLLTANNHSYDTGLSGFKRTQEIVSKSGIDHIGTRLDINNTPYLVKDINGIKVGMICYTYETKTEREGRKALNGILLDSSANDLINSFDPNDLDSFYNDISDKIEDMRVKGAECIVTYMHWGNEYQLTANSTQNTMAQKLCDFGVDVIIGGHPHVVQNVDMLTSASNPNQKTVCIYSLGNAVSNQRTSRSALKTGHTEDGMLFSFTLKKYSDGTVNVHSADIIPTWVNLHTKNGKAVYEIVPLDESGCIGLNSTANANAVKSYNRTMKIVGGGLDKIKSSLAIENSDSSTLSSNTD